MTKGLVRANNFSDLADKDEAVVNLGLSAADYAALKGLYTTAGIDFSVIGEIGNSQGNYQAQLDGISTTLSGVVLSGYVNRSGDTILGTWTHSGIINISSGLPSGYPASTDSLFSLSIESGEAVIVASGLTASGLSYNGVRQSRSTVVRALPPSGFNTLNLIPLQVGGQAFFAQASESPSFYIAPARTGTALDLVTGNFVGSYNSASPAYAVGPDGILALPAANAPVLEYDPVTLQCLGARIWGSVTNLLLRSEEFDVSATWAVVGTVSATSNSDIAPNATTTADRLSISAGSYIRQFVGGITAGASYTISVWVKKPVSSGANAIRLTSNNVNAWSTGFSQKFTLTSTWQRITATGVLASSNTNAYVIIGAKTETNADDPDCVGDVLIWGAQLNTGSVAGPYVPTTTTTASSTADAWTITGSDFARIISQTEGTVYWEGSAATDSNSRFCWGISSNGDYSNSHNFMRQSDAQPVFRTLNGGAGQYEIGFGANWTSSNANRRAAYAYRQNDFAGIVNGTSLQVDAIGSLPTTNRIDLGTLSGISYINGHIREFALFRSRRPNANLQALTQ